MSAKRISHMVRFVCMSMTKRYVEHRDLGSFDPKRCAYEDLVGLNFRKVGLTTHLSRTMDLSTPYQGDASLVKLPKLDDLLSMNISPSLFPKVM
jgi:hypothetical protein